MQRRSTAEFQAEPRGGYVAGGSWLYFALSSGATEKSGPGVIGEPLYGYLLWGKPDADDLRALVAQMERELARPPHDAFVDLSALENAAPDAFEVLAAWTVKNAGALAEKVRHTAIVRPSGVLGAVVSGFFEMSSRPFPVSFWPSAEAALRHLQREDAGADIAALAAARAEVTGEPALLRSVREHADIDAAARALSLSTRTLQRRLGELGTTFEKELRRARVDRAARLLVETERAITAIALDVGFATPQHFATAFQERFGETPTAWRQRERDRR